MRGWGGVVVHIFNLHSVDNPYLSTFIHKQGVGAGIFGGISVQEGCFLWKIDVFRGAVVFGYVDNF